MALTLLLYKFFIPAVSITLLAGVGAGVAHHLGYFPSEQKTIQPSQAVLVGITTNPIVSVSKQSDTSLLDDYKCRLAAATRTVNEPFECTVEAFEPSTNGRNQETLTVIKTKPATHTSPAKSSLIVSNKVFRVFASDESVAKFTTANSKLEIVTSTASPEVLSSLDFLFGVKSDSSIVGSTTTFVGKIETVSPPTSSGATGTSKSPSKLVCSKSETLSTSSDQKECDIFTFTTNESSPSADTTHTSLDFNDSTTPPAGPTQHKHYIIKFTDPVPPTMFLTDNKLYIHQVPSSGTPADSDTKRITFKSVTPVVITEETTPRALMLK